MPQPAPLYRAIGAAPGCRALATAFYANVARDPILRPFFPSTFTCAIEEFSAFLVQFLGGESEATQRRWWLSLRESHSRFPLGPRERDAWLQAMAITLDNHPNPDLRATLLAFFEHASAHIVHHPAAPPLTGELAPLWNEQLAVDQAVALIRSPAGPNQALAHLQSPALQTRFARSPSVHASLLALAAQSPHAALRHHAAAQIRAHPALIHERYSHARTLLHDASAAGDLPLVQQLLEMGAQQTGPGRSPLYCVANECSAPTAAHVVHALLDRAPDQINAPYGVKRCTALHMAARRGNTAIIAALLDRGAHPHSIGNHARTLPMKRLFEKI